MDDQSLQQIEEIEKQTGKPTGIGKVMRGECPEHYVSPVACTLCPYGHMLECHHPHTCEEAKCGHYHEMLEQDHADNFGTEDGF